MLGKPPEQPHLSFEQGSSFTPPPVLFLLSWSNCFNKQNSFLCRAFCPFSCQSLTVSPYAMICFGFPSSDFVFRFLLSLRWEFSPFSETFTTLSSPNPSAGHRNGAGSSRSRELLSTHPIYVHKLTFLCVKCSFYM